MWAILFRKIPHRWYILVILLYCAETGNWFQHSPLVYICFHVVVVSRFIHSQLIRVNNPVTILSHSDQMRAINPHPCTSTYTLSSQHCLFCIYVSFYIPKNRRTQRYQPKTIQNSVLETVQKHYYLSFCDSSISPFAYVFCSLSLFLFLVFSKKRSWVATAVQIFQ